MTPKRIITLAADVGLAVAVILGAIPAEAANGLANGLK